MADERYVLEQKIGAGGMGEVWRAKDTLLGRPVAVKFLQATNERRFIDLFLSEARTLASLQHPNITLIYDAVFDEEEARFYIMMEYVQGKSLKKLIEEAGGPLPLNTTVNITCGILEALSYAHRQGFVHRDIKPENVLIQANQVKLTDFGLAALVSLLAEQDDGTIAGSPAYMAPEQIAGEQIDGRADLYSLGITLFEMVTGGRRPFETDDFQQLFTAHIEQEAPSVRLYAPTAPLTLERIIARLLAKFPEERYESAQDVLDLFRGFQARQKFNQPHLQLLDPTLKPLLGREDQLKRLGSLWAEVQASGHPRLVLVEGETGIGKSRLVTEFVATQVVDHGLAAVAGQCVELGAAYSPYAEILATIFEKGLVKPATLENQINYLLDQLPNLAPLLNVKRPTAESLPKAGVGLWQTLSDRLPAGGVQDPVQARQQFFTTVQTIFAELGPGVVFLIDAHDMDDASAALTRFLVRHSHLPLLVLAELATNDQPPAWLSTLSEEEKEILTLPALPAHLLKPFLTNFLGGPVSDAMVRIVERRGRGNPLHIEETTRQLVDAGDFYQHDEGWEYLPPPETGSLSEALVSPFLANAFTRQLERLSDESHDLLTRAALLEPAPEFDFELWLATLGGESQRAAAQAALDEALQRRIVRQQSGSRYIFRPADIATALAAQLAPAKRRQLHHTLAEALRQQQAAPRLVAYHLEQAGLPTAAAAYLELMGAQAAANQAVDEAIDCYKRALDLVETVTGYDRLGVLYRQQGAWGESKQALTRALDLLGPNPDVNLQASLMNDLAFTLWLADDYRAAAEQASAVLKLSGVSRLERATAQSHLGMVAWLVGHLAEAESWCRKAVEQLTGQNQEAKLAEAANRLGLVYGARAKFADAATVTDQSLALRRKLGETWGEAFCLTSLGQLEADQGHFAEASRYFAAARNLFEQISSSDGLMVANIEEARALVLQQRVAEAMPLLKKALRLAQLINKTSAPGLGEIYLIIAQASLQLGEYSRARAAAQDALKRVEPLGAQKHIAAGWAVLAQVHAHEAEPVTAESLFKKALAVFEQIDHPPGLLRTRLAYAQFLAGQQRPEAAALEQSARAEARRLGLHLSS